MNKKLLVSSVIFALVLAVNSASAKPASQGADPDLPEVEGTYDVPGHPELKVRVFVHRVKPTPTISPVTVCYLPDPVSDAIVDKEAWRLPDGAWTYRLNPASVPASVGGTNLLTIADNAFDVWSAAAVGAVTFTKGPDTSATRASLDYKNIVAWGRAPGSALGVTYIWYYPSTGFVADVDTIMNKKFPWSWTNQVTNPNCADKNSYDAQNILTHEIGHWLGLDDEYNTTLYQHNTMYGYGSKGEVKKDTLTAGDIAGVNAIY